MAVAGRGGAEPMAREWCLGTIIAMSVGIQVLFHVLVSAVPPRGRSRTRTASPPRVPATDFFCPAPEPEEPRVAVGIVDGSADGIVDGIVDGTVDGNSRCGRVDGAAGEEAAKEGDQFDVAPERAGKEPDERKHSCKGFSACRNRREKLK